MNGAASRLIGLLALACICACTTSPAVEALCDDDVDQDGDNLFDCADPDCQASDDCVGSRAAPVRPPPADGGHFRPPVLGSDAAAKDGEVGDAWTQDPDATTAPREDAQVVPPIEDDAGEDPCLLCAVNETCVAGSCQPAAAPTSGAYDLQLLMGTVPATNAQAFCYDACVILAGVCPCQPDPYVRIVLLHDGREQLVGVTQAVEETVTPVFPPMPFAVDLAAGDVLRFDVYD
ncbi:MAG TPA: hypothetical protein VK509_14835, partial [Polyangiales bacterium]|nr:hypothetical protein [Polyangiales bacterium]